MRSSSSLRVLAIVAAFVALAAWPVQADVYMHHPRGGNDRLNEGGPERANGDRLWDSQNNNRGGYNVGSIQRIYYFEGTVVPIEWTQQHSCGNREGNHCEMIIQYSCDDKRVRDGQTTNTIPVDNAQCANNDCDLDGTFGRHESEASYSACRYRSRNKGLFLGTQRMRALSARFTRQNNDGARSGLECPEERDYYPYWHPSIWRDVAIVTNHPERCAAYQAESQNVKGRSYCQWDTTDPKIQERMALVQNGNRQDLEGFVPITKAECETPGNTQFPANSGFTWPGGKWIDVPAFGIPAPDCVEAPFTRDNHLGNAIGAPSTTSDTAGYTAQYNWTVPYGVDSPYCVLRLRYNISTGEFPSQGFASDSSVSPNAAVDHTQNVVPFGGGQDKDNNGRYPAEFPLWLKYGLRRVDNDGSFTERVRDDDPNNNNNGRQGGIKISKPVSRDYTFRNNPQVDIFGSLLSTNNTCAAPCSTSDANYKFQGQAMIRLRLAINTAQFGRTFEDRTHVFEIRARPSNMQNSKIHNLSVRGKRGNIVQVYPGVEYDFVPDRLEIDQGDLVHIQWTGSGPQTGEGAGNQGDRSNIVMLRDRNYEEFGQPERTHQLAGAWGNAYPALINDTTGTQSFLGWDITLTRALALYGLNFTHFDLGAVQVRTTGEFKYLCTRNNAFSNRSHKGLIVVRPSKAFVEAGYPEANGPVPVSRYGWTETPSGKARLTQDSINPGVVTSPGAITINDACKAGSCEWSEVSPPTELDTQSVITLTASRPQEGNFFMKGKLMWKLNIDDEPVEIIPDSGFYSAKNRVTITQGGYYKSTSVPNTAMIAGITLGCVGLIAIFVFLYWRVRVQPEGGWKAFCSKDKAATDYDNAELTSSSAPSSSSPRV